MIAERRHNTYDTPFTNTNMRMEATRIPVSITPEEAIHVLLADHVNLVAALRSELGELIDSLFTLEGDTSDELADVAFWLSIGLCMKGLGNFWLPGAHRTVEKLARRCQIIADSLEVVGLPFDPIVLLGGANVVKPHKAREIFRRSHALATGKDPATASFPEHDEQRFMRFRSHVFAEYARQGVALR